MDERFLILEELLNKHDYLWDDKNLSDAVNLIILFGRPDLLELFFKSKVAQVNFMSKESRIKVDCFI